MRMSGSFTCKCQAKNPPTIVKEKSPKQKNRKEQGPAENHAKQHWRKRIRMPDKAFKPTSSLMHKGLLFSDKKDCN